MRNLAEGNIYIYGAGVVGRRLKQQLIQYRLKITAYLVTNKENMENQIDGIPVIELDAVKWNSKDVFFLAVSNKYVNEMKQNLNSRGIHSYITLGEDIDMQLKEEYFLRILSTHSKGYYWDSEYLVENAYRGLALKGLQGEKYHWRILFDEGLLSDKIYETLSTKGIKEQFEQSYGTYHQLEELRNTKKNEIDTFRILMACCHCDKKTKDRIDKEYIIPIQVGKTLTNQDICQLKDNTGIHISQKNRDYCECTALYWMWQNHWGQEYDYVGLCHYRRQMKISESELQNLKANGVDLVLTVPTFVSDLPTHFAMCTGNSKDWTLMKEAVQILYPEYLEAFEKYENQHMICQCNMLIIRRSYLDEYCKFLFTILEYVEQYYRTRMERNDRYLGYLAENLLSVFQIKNRDRLKTFYTDMIMLSE